MRTYTPPQLQPAFAASAPLRESSPHQQAKPPRRVRCSSILEDVEAAVDQTGTVWLHTNLPHQQAKRPLGYRQSFTHSGPLTSHGAFRPRAAAREAVLRTSDLA